MANIGISHKITNLWPARPSRPMEQFGLGKKQPKNQQNKNQQNNENETEEESPGNTIDEYV